MNQTTQAILDIFESYRMEPTGFDEYLLKGKAILAEKIDGFVRNYNTVKFVMLGFPFKSTNLRDKVLSSKPDKAELVTLQNFSQFNEDIRKIYPPGVEITIMADGYVFNSLMGVEDRTVEEYLDISGDMGDAVKAPMKWYTLHHFYGGFDLVNKREKLLLQFGITEEELERRILVDMDVNWLYRGMLKFMHEELSWRRFEGSGKELKRKVKDLTRRLMMMNEAWSNVVKKEFPDHIRLSMHPSTNNGNKFSFKLIPGNRTHHSAWHSALWIDGNEYVTIHRSDAEKLHLDIVYEKNQPFYFVNEQ